MCDEINFFVVVIVCGIIICITQARNNGLSGCERIVMNYGCRTIFKYDYYCLIVIGIFHPICKIRHISV